MWKRSPRPLATPATSLWWERRVRVGRVVGEPVAWRTSGSSDRGHVEDMTRAAVLDDRTRHPGTASGAIPGTRSLGSRGRLRGIPDGAAATASADDGAMDAPPIEPPSLGPDDPGPRARPPARRLHAAPAPAGAPLGRAPAGWRGGRGGRVPGRRRRAGAARLRRHGVLRRARRDRLRARLDRAAAGSTGELGSTPPARTASSSSATGSWRSG